MKILKNCCANSSQTSYTIEDKRSNNKGPTSLNINKFLTFSNIR